MIVWGLTFDKKIDLDLLFTNKEQAMSCQEDPEFEVMPKLVKLEIKKINQ